MDTIDATDADADPEEPTVDGEDGGLLAYETETGVVICDPENPAAWIESDAVVRTDERR